MPNVAELIKDHVTVEVDSGDRRLYLKAYVPRLQSAGGVVGFLAQRGQTIPSPARFGTITQAFKTDLRTWCDQEGIPWLEFKKGERKDDVVQPYRDRFMATEGVVLVGVAQDRATDWRATKQMTGRAVHFTYARTSVCVNHYYVSCLDREWGPGFLTVCGYAPSTLKLCLNGHAWAKRQLTQRGIASGPFHHLRAGFQVEPLRGLATSGSRAQPARHPGLPPGATPTWSG